VVQLYSFLTLALNGVQRSNSLPVALPTRREKTVGNLIGGYFDGRVGLDVSGKLLLECSLEYFTCTYTDVLQVSSFLKILREKFVYICFLSCLQRIPLSLMCLFSCNCLKLPVCIFNAKNSSSPFHGTWRLSTYPNAIFPHPQRHITMLTITLFCRLSAAPYSV